MLGQNNLVARKRFTTTKTILLIGATGSGKSTMVDRIVNHIYRVSFKDNYRLKIIDLKDGEEKENKSKSETEWITAYTIIPNKHNSINYALTIVDMPGFGDTRGLKCDEELMINIKKLFSTRDDSGLEAINAVCFVVKSNDARLTQCQQYIFDSAVKIFAKDVKDLIQVFVSFAERSDPLVLDALKDAKLPYNKYFKFNNLGMSSNDDNIAAEYWKMSEQELDRFFNHLKQAKATSLVLSQTVLEERDKLMTILDTLQTNIQLMNDINNNQVQEEEFNKMKIKALKCMEELDKIALRKGPPDIERYLDSLIENERQQRQGDYQARIENLEKHKNRAMLEKLLHNM